MSSKSRIPALTRGMAVQSSKQPKTFASKQSSNTAKSSNLLHYGFAAVVKTNAPARSGKKKAELQTEDKEIKEKSRAVKDDVSDHFRKVDSSTKSSDLSTTDERMSDTVQDEECGAVTKEGATPNDKHMNLSEVQLHALSYSLSELADKISPSKSDHFDDEKWETEKPRVVGTERTNSLGRSRVPSDAVSAPHSKSPYSRKNKTEEKPYLSKQKSFNKIKPPLASREINLSGDDKAKNSEMQNDKGSTEKEEIMFKAASPSHQESTESGYNSSWSVSSLSEDKNGKHGTDADTDVDMDFKDLNDEPFKGGPNMNEQLKDEISGAEYERVLQKKISDVEKRINSLILGRNSIDLPETSATEDDSTGKLEESQRESLSKNASKSNCLETLKDDKDEHLTNGFENDLHNEPDTGDFKINNTIEPSKLKSMDSSTRDQELSQKFPSPVQKIRRTSLGESPVNSKPKRPGLVRRRTTLVTFRHPRQTSAFNEVDDSGVLEIDEAGFVQCLTDVRAMKTMLLKLKRELQEAEVVSPLAKPKPLSSRNITNVSETNGSYEETGLRRNTYDSSEGIQSLRHIRSASLSRRKQSSCLECPTEEQLAAEKSTESSVEELKQNSTDKKIENMKVEMNALKEKNKQLKEERDTLFMDKEEIEHELEAKNHTIKLLQKQLEVHENDEEMAYLQRQVEALTSQVHQQQQKITELKYRSSTPPNAPRSSSPTNFSMKKDSVKQDIKNRLRDAFVRHLEESSKSHVLLSKHIEKAEFTIGEAQKGLKSLYVAPTSQNPASKENLTEVAKSSDKTRPSANLLRTPRTPNEEIRRHSWTANSIDKIMKTWKETTKSIEDISSGQSTNNKPSTQLPKPKGLKNSPHLEFL